MEAAIAERHEADIELIRGGGGIFDVTVDGELIYSKHETGRFPEHDEILSRLAKTA